ncbi:iron-sulfur cluster carrier protein ApbC [Thalassotalea agariperforans]
MFKKLFPSKKVSDQHIEMISETLSAYRSSSFPLGVLAVCEPPTFTAVKSGIEVALVVPFPCISELNDIALTLSEQLALTVTFNIAFHVLPVREHHIAGIRNVIAVASGKGGVGKSTTSVNLAYALQAEGARVGILDADIYGPSIPTMLGVTDKKPMSRDGQLMIPVEANGLVLNSIGFLVPDEDAAVWRGPMASKAFDQLLHETLWGELDYLIIDMPPGTGDIQITLSEKVPVAASVVVTTPQNVALADAIKGIAMFEKVNIPVLGVIENMSYHICDACGNKAHLFGEGGGQFVAEQYQTQLLGHLPLNSDIRADMDCGLSPLIENSAGEIAQQYRKIARNTAAQLFLQLDNRSPLTPDVVISE